MTEEDQTLLRTPENHDRQTQEIEDAQDEAEKIRLSREYGINRRCQLNELTGSHATITAPDLMHDDLLGICIVTTRCYPNKICFEDEFITLDILNEKIQEFDFEYSEKSSKPSIIKKKLIINKDEEFRQNASQMWQLVTMLPLILADHVPEAYPPHQNFLMLLQILCISFGDKIIVPMISYLKFTIGEYLQTFKDIYKIPLTPKQHFLLHRPMLITKLGPVSHFVTIREEAKHQQFKREAQFKRTYKNLPITLGKKHQLFQASVVQEVLEYAEQTGPKKLIDVDSEPFRTFFRNNTHVYSTTWIKFNGIKYEAKKCLIAVGYDERNLPEFRAIDFICLENEVVVLLCKKVITIEHNLSIMAYEIEILDEIQAYTFNDVISHDVFHTHQCNERQFIIVKKALGDIH
ncbi:uncharacterized protein LOC122499985 [Leptopilina heterotoma]|uniref:uncharacterized protein LOC122499985 n=1 Tax=Leptopilina heterotoma TaxID=63436 RepID=UPI001CA8BEE2|nr:uncharacterized protein LOC122499985 [Leptopilina heterotoma]